MMKLRSCANKPELRFCSNIWQFAVLNLKRKSDRILSSLLFCFLLWRRASSHSLCLMLACGLSVVVRCFACFFFNPTHQLLESSKTHAFFVRCFACFFFNPTHQLLESSKTHTFFLSSSKPPFPLGLETARKSWRLCQGGKFWWFSQLGADEIRESQQSHSLCPPDCGQTWALSRMLEVNPFSSLLTLRFFGIKQFLQYSFSISWEPSNTLTDIYSSERDENSQHWWRLVTHDDRCWNDFPAISELESFFFLLLFLWSVHTLEMTANTSLCRELMITLGTLWEQRYPTTSSFLFQFFFLLMLP